MEFGSIRSRLQEEFKAEYGLSSDALFVDNEVNKGGNRLENYARALERSKKMMQIIDTAIDLMRRKHKKRRVLFTGFCTTPISPRSSARMRVQFCSRSKPRESPFLCAPTMSTGMKPSKFSVRFCGATPPKIARKSPICLPPIEPAQHPQYIRRAKAFFPAQSICYYGNGLLLAAHKAFLHTGGFNDQEKHVFFLP